MAKLQDGSFYRVVSTINGRFQAQLYAGSSLQTAEKRLAMRANLINHASQDYGVRLELRFVRGADHSYQVLDAWQQGLDDKYQESVKNTCGRVNITHRKLNKIGLYASGHYTVSDRERQAMDDQLDWLFAQRELGLIELCDNERGCIYWHGVNCKCWFDVNGQVLKKAEAK